MGSFLRLFVGLMVFGIGSGLGTAARAGVVPQQDQLDCCPKCQDVASVQCRATQAALKSPKEVGKKTKSGVAEVAR